MPEMEQKANMYLILDDREALVLDFINKREQAKRSVIEDDVEVAIQKVRRAKEAEYRVRDILNQVKSRDIGTQALNKSSRSTEKPTLEQDQMRELLIASIKRSRFASFQEIDVEVVNNQYSHTLDKRVSRDYMWGMEMLTGSGIPEFAIFKREFGIRNWYEAQFGNFFCVAGRNQQNDVYLVGGGRIHRDSCWRENPSAIHLILDGSRQEYVQIINRFEREPKLVLIGVLKYCFDVINQSSDDFHLSGIPEDMIVQFRNKL